MTWLVWRQHRNQAYFAAAALAAFAVLLLITGLQMASQYRSALTACAANGNCNDLGGTLTLGSAPVIFLVLLTMAVPALLGVFWGAPLVAREFETGTGQFAWMQSITRGRWLAVKAGWILLAAAAWGGAVTALVTWWSSPLNSFRQQNFKPGQFDIQGIVPAGYALFAVALGIAAGTLVRRTLPALALTLGIFASLRFVIAYFVRPHYMSPVTVTSGILHSFQPAGSIWQLGSGTMAPDGRVFQSGGLSRFLGGTRVTINLPASCKARLFSQGPRKIAECLSAHGYHSTLSYQPASRYWPFQGIETGIFVLLAAVLIALTAIILLRRDA